MTLRQKFPGLKFGTEAVERIIYVGRGAFCMGRSYTERSGGLYRSENAGMSSERRVRIPPVVSLRFPEEGSSTQG